LTTTQAQLQPFFWIFFSALSDFAIHLRNKGLQSAAIAEAIVVYTVSGLDDREILARIVVAPDVRNAE
jgi:hypothetical protein